MLELSNRKSRKKINRTNGSKFAEPLEFKNLHFQVVSRFVKFWATQKNVEFGPNSREVLAHTHRFQNSLAHAHEHERERK
jgi:hypothetical protein